MPVGTRVNPTRGFQLFEVGRYYRVGLENQALPPKQINGSPSRRKIKNEKNKLNRESNEFSILRLSTPRAISRERIALLFREIQLAQG